MDLSSSPNNNRATIGADGMKLSPLALALGALVLVVIVVLLVRRPPPPADHRHRDPGSLPGGFFPPGGLFPPATHGGECTGNGDCPGGQYCEHGYCFWNPSPGSPGKQTPGGAAAICTADVGCEAGLYCKAMGGGVSTCQQQEVQDQPCTADIGCADSLRCQAAGPGYRTCQPWLCNGDPDCKSGQKCVLDLGTGIATCRRK